MDERGIQFRVGVVVLAAVVMTGILVVVLGTSRNVFARKYTVNVEFPQAPGVAKDTPVRKSGVLIGRVTSVYLQPRGSVTISMLINRDYPLHRHEVCTVSTKSLVTNDAIVEFIPAVGDPGEPLTDGEYLHGQISPDPFQVFVRLAQDIQPAIRAIENAGHEVSRLSQNLNSVLGNNEGQMQRILQKTETSLDSFHVAMQKVDNVVGDEELQQKLRKALADFPELVSDIQLTMKDARTALNGVARMSAKAEENLDNLSGFTKPLGEQGGQLVTGLTSSLDHLDQVLVQLVTFSESLNSSDGTVGKLVRDDELYRKLNRAVGNVEDATRRLRPIMDDARVLSDKLARDPGGTIGLKSLFNRNPSGFKTGPAREPSMPSPPRMIRPRPWSPER